LRGSILLYAAQAIPPIDAEIAMKGHLWTETSSRVGENLTQIEKKNGRRLVSAPASVGFLVKWWARQYSFGNIHPAVYDVLLSGLVSAAYDSTAFSLPDIGVLLFALP
jgi:hypothetical protein